MSGLDADDRQRIEPPAELVHRPVSDEPLDRRRPHDQAVEPVWPDEVVDRIRLRPVTIRAGELCADEGDEIDSVRGGSVGRPKPLQLVEVVHPTREHSDRRRLPHVLMRDSGSRRYTAPKSYAALDDPCDVGAAASTSNRSADEHDPRATDPYAAVGPGLTPPGRTSPAWSSRESPPSSPSYMLPRLLRELGAAASSLN